MSIIAGYTRQTDGTNIVIGNYDSVDLAETAVQDSDFTDIAQYWLASSFNTDTNEADIFAYIDP